MNHESPPSSNPWEAPFPQPSVPLTHAPTGHPLKQDSPPHLRPETAEWWAAVARDFSLEPHQIRLLTLACEAWDRGQEAREAISEHGSTYIDRFGQPRARPEVAIERDSRISFARLLRELSLDADGASDGGRPPRIQPGRKELEPLDPDDPFYDIFKDTDAGKPRRRR